MAALCRVKPEEKLNFSSEHRQMLRPALRLRPPNKQRIGLRVRFDEDTIFTPAPRDYKDIYQAAATKFTVTTTQTVTILQ